MSKIISFNCRTFSLPNFTAPLYVHSMDIDTSISNLELPVLLKQVSSVSNHHIVTINKWLSISSLVIEILKNENFWSRLVIIKSFEKSEIVYSWVALRGYVLNKITKIQVDESQLTYLMALNSVYRASEGEVPVMGYPLSVLGEELFFNVLQSELFQLIDKKRSIEISREEIVAWFRVFNLIITKPTPDFKKYFNEILNYEIPYGLSPETKSMSLESIIKNSKNIAVVPMLTGINSISTALVNGDWVIAVQAAASTGAVVIILLSSLALSDKIIGFINRREVK